MLGVCKPDSFPRLLLENIPESSLVDELLTLSSSNSEGLSFKLVFFDVFTLVFDRLLFSMLKSVSEGSCSSSLISLLLFCSSMTSASPTSVEPILKRTRFLWARRQFLLISSRMPSIAEHIFRAGPSLIDIADMR